MGEGGGEIIINYKNFNSLIVQEKQNTINKQMMYLKYTTNVQNNITKIQNEERCAVWYS